MERRIKSFVTTKDGSGDRGSRGNDVADMVNPLTRLGDVVGSGGGNGYGWGIGFCTGSGNGDGTGGSKRDESDIDSGNGDGTGKGSGNGFGIGDGMGDYYGGLFGSGYGNGSGNGMEDDGDLLSITRVGDNTIYNINGAPIAIDNIKGNIAKGRILNDDMTFTDCWIVREGNCIEYGKDLHDTHKAAQRESAIQLPKEERLKMFVQRFPSPDELIPIKELYNWHHVLTGACKYWSKEWCKQNGFNVEDEIYCVSIRKFVNLTEFEWGGDIIKELKNYYKDW